MTLKTVKIKYTLFWQFKDLESASLQQATSIVLQLRDVMKSHFPEEEIKESVERRLKRAEKNKKAGEEDDFFNLGGTPRNIKSKLWFLSKKSLNLRRSICGHHLEEEKLVSSN